jgi:two-component system sensor histidine kinase YesM
MFRKWRLRSKISFSVAAYILVIGVIGNGCLYQFLLAAVSRKAERLDRISLEVVRQRLDRNFADVLSLAALCANDPVVLQTVSQPERTGREFLLDSLNIQERFNMFLRANPMNLYIDKLVLFDNQGLFIQAASRVGGMFTDLDEMRNLPLYKRFIAEDRPWTDGFGHPITPWYLRDCYALFFRLAGDYHNLPESYLYVEMGMDMVTNVFRDYAVPSGVFLYVPETAQVVLQNRPRLVQPEPGEPGYVPRNADFPYRFRQGGRSYRLDLLQMENSRFVLYNQVDVSSLAEDDRRLLYTTLAAVLISLLAAAGLGVMLSAFLTRPIETLISRIRKISEENDFSPDPAIEKQQDEIGLIGRAVNEMSGSISNFLGKMEESYRKQKKVEIALLQTQINPHFLYNTLGAVHWMAKIQNNPAIADITSRLINLLRHIASRASADGENAKITLAEELCILEDYTEIMSVRFMGIFEIVNRIGEPFLAYRIPKLTLQPLVENAILHSIEPSGRFGVITLSAQEDETYLSVMVEDTGIGMSREQIETINARGSSGKQDGPSLNNIGIANVDERLKLLYGESCGLFYESRQGEYTRVTVRILKEQ